MRISTTKPAYRAHDIDLWGHEFQTVDLPRSKGRKAGEIQERLNNLGDDADDEGIALFGELLDLMLVSTNGNRTKPSTLLKKKWAGDETTPFEIGVLVGKIKAADEKTAIDSIQETITQRPT